MSTILPYPITWVEDGVILYYFITEQINPNSIKKVSFSFKEDLPKDVCVFNEMFAVPLDIIERALQNKLKYLYFMGYNFQNVESWSILSFEISTDFIIEFKSYLRYKELYEKQNQQFSEKTN